MSALHITGENFEEEVIRSDRPVLLDFWASWCGPCRRMGPVVDRIAEKRPDVKVGKVNVDEEPELAAAFQIANIPTLTVMKNGKVAGQTVGADSEEQILAMLESDE